MTSIPETSSSSNTESHPIQPEAGAAPLARIARDLLGSEAFGLRNMPWKAATDVGTSMAVLDVDWLVQQPLLPFLVPALPPQLLHRSLVAHGLEDSVEVVEWLRGKQLTRVLDFDLWQYDTENLTHDLNSSQVVRWFRVWLEVGTEFVAERIFDLEEETLVILFSKILEIQPEGLGNRNPEHDDSYWTTLDGRFHLRVLDPNPETFEVVKQVIDAIYSADIKYAGTILSHASMLVRNESLEQAERWREGRLADAGFVHRDEALAALKQKKLADVQAAALAAVDYERERRRFRQQVGSPAAAQGEIWGGFAEDRMELVEEFVELIANADHDAAGNLLAIGLGAEKYQALLTDDSAPAQILSDREMVETAAEEIANRCIHLIAAVDAARAREFRHHRLLVERVFSALAETEPEEASNLKARLGRLTNLVVAGTSTQPDDDALERAVALVRGAANVGLEFLLRENVISDLPLPGGSDPFAVSRGLEVLGMVGVEHLFHVGWNLLLALSESFAAQLDSIPCCALSDGGSWLDHWRTQRFVVLRRCLQQEEQRFDPGLFHVASSLLNRVPLFPEMLAVRENTLRATTARRAFETLADVEAAQEFVARLPTLIME